MQTSLTYIGRRLRTSRLIILLALVAVFSALQVAPALAQGDSPDRLVLAFYYAWFDEKSWGADRVPDRPSETYVSRDRIVMGRQIEQAKNAGIDAFVVSWYGPQQVNNQTETNLRALLDEAAARGFRIAVDFETGSPFYGGVADIQSGLAHLLGVHAQHPAYLRSGGKPVVFFWRQQRLKLGQWEAVRNAVDPVRNSLWIEEGVDVTPLKVFDGHHLYSVTWNPPTDLGQTARKFATRVRSYSQTSGVPKVYVATVMPGYDDRKTGRGNAFAKDREGGAYYARSWQAAIASAPDWIVITSFNEWPEGTYIEPSQQYGDAYLQLTAQWSAAFRGAPPPPAGPAAKPVPVRAAGVAQASKVKPAAKPVPTPTPKPVTMPNSPVERPAPAVLPGSGLLPS